MLGRLALLGALGLACLQASDIVRAADLLRVDGRPVKWPPPQSGTTTVITYAVLSQSYLVAHNTRVLSRENCGRMRPLSDITASSPDLDQVSIGRALRSALTAWENVADIKFVEVATPQVANVVIGATEAPYGPAFANLRLRDGSGLQQSTDKALSGPNEGTWRSSAGSSGDNSVAIIDQAFVCLNPKVPWKTGFDGNLAIYDLRHAFMHEIGHAIGLDHPGSTGSVMGFRYDESVRGPQRADIIALQQLYGAPAKN